MKAKATHTEFLERLLAIEVTAVEARRHAGLLRFANFPAPWQLADFDFTDGVDVEIFYAGHIDARGFPFTAHEVVRVDAADLAKEVLRLHRVPLILG